MVIMVTADPLLPKLEPPPDAEAPPGGREQRSILPPALLCLSFSLPFLRAGGAASFWVYLEAVAAGYDFSTGRGAFAHSPPAPLFSTLHPGSLPRFFDLYLSPSLFPFFWAGQTGFFWVSAGTVAAQCVIASIPAEEREMSLATIEA